MIKMKKIYSIGYIDKYNDFLKVSDEKGYTLKVSTIEEAEDYINKELINKGVRNIRIMQGWKIIKEVK